MKLNILPVRAGAQWVKLGARTFFRQPLALGALLILFLLTLLLVTLLPIVGNIVMLALVPALTVGLMAAAREADGGKIPLPTILFIAFRQGAARARAIIVLGLLYAVATVAVIGISALIDQRLFLALILGYTEASTSDQLNALIRDPRFGLALRVAFMLYLPVSLAFWHTPALVHWHGIAPVKSLFFSCVAVRKNIRPFLLYGLMWLALFLGASVALAFLTALTGSAAILLLGQLPVALLLGALFLTSKWFTFRDSFTVDQRPDDALLR